MNKFFDERKMGLELIEVGHVVQITADATGLSKSTVKRICSKGAVTGRSFRSPQKCYDMSRKKISYR